jgi:hypothetical protein
MPRRHYSSYAVSRRATQRSQDKADDEYYAGLAKKREAEEAAAQAQNKTEPEGEKKNG